MADGYLNKCKDCTRKDVKEHSLYLKKNDPDYLEKEKKRGRLKYHRLYKGVKPNKQLRGIARKRWANKYPEKEKAKCVSSKIKSINGNNHHWSYRQEHWKDVIDLTVKNHSKAHRFIIYDQEQMMYRRIDNMELLDTREKHLKWILHCIETRED